MSAGAIQETRTTMPPGPGREEGTFVNRIALAWTADSSGDVNGIPMLTPVSGTLLKVQFVPSTTNNPNLGYSVTLLDGAGIDVLAGQGASLTLTPTAMCPGVPFTNGTASGIVPCALADALELNVADAGADTEGQVILFVR